MSEREEFQRLLNAARQSSDDADLRAWWCARYSASAYALLQCAFSCAIIETQQWTRLTVPDGDKEHYVGRFDKERGLLELQYRNKKRLFDISSL